MKPISKWTNFNFMIWKEKLIIKVFLLTWRTWKDFSQPGTFWMEALSMNQINHRKIDILLKGNYSTVDFESLTGFVLPAQDNRIGTLKFQMLKAMMKWLKICVYSKSNLEGTQLNIPAPFNKNFWWGRTIFSSFWATMSGFQLDNGFW